MSDHRGDQRDIVNMLPGPNADFAAPFRLGELLVGDRILRHAVFRCVDDACPPREPDPLIVFSPIGGRDSSIDALRLNGLGNTRCRRLGEIAHIYGEQEIGRTVLSLGFNTLDQALLGEQDVDLDPCLLSELFEQRLDQGRLTVGINIDLARGCGLYASGENKGKFQALLSRGCA